MNRDIRTIAERAARELSPGMTVNLGIGLPTVIPAVLPENHGIVFHSENGFVGMGPPLDGGTPDHHVIDAGGRACTLVTGAACFDSLLSFAIVRGGRLDAAVLGAFEVGLDGSLANWMIPGKLTPGMGGGMELAQKARRVIVVSRHLDKKGQAKLVERCRLPLTASRCVNTFITERALFRRLEGEMTLCSVAPGHTLSAALEGIACNVAVVSSLEPWEDRE